MPTKRKPAIRVKKEHYCTQEEAIKRMSHILVGNGSPEDGLAFKFKEFMIDHKLVVSNIEEIKEGVKELKRKAEANAKAAATAQSAIEKFKLETESYDKGIKEEESRVEIADALKRKIRSDNWQKVIWIIMALMGLAGIYLNNKKSADNGRKIETLGMPVITNSRGQITALPNGDSIKYFTPDGWKTKDSVKK